MYISGEYHRIFPRNKLQGKAGVAGMKKIISVFLLLLFVFSISLTAKAAGEKEYTIDKLNRSVKIPDGLNILTRNMSADDPAIKKLGGMKVS